MLDLGDGKAMARLHHMGITVSNTEEAIAFYSSLTCGTVTGPLVKQGPAVEAVTGYPGAQILITFIAFDGGNSVIELAEYRGTGDQRLIPDNGKAGSAHPAIVVRDIEGEIKRLAANGYAATSAPMVATAGPMEGYRYAYIIGPDDVRVELLEEPH